MPELSPIALIHIAGGLVAIVAGPLSLLAPKGRWLHRRAGTAFFYSMLVMAGAALVASVFKGHKVNLAASALTLYLVVTAWSIVKARAGTVTLVERWAPFAAAAIALGALSVGILTAAAPGLIHEGDANAPTGFVIFMVFAAIGALAAGADLWTLRRGGLSGAARISRHLWRMCLGLFVALGSFSAQAPLLAKRLELPAPPGLATFGPALAVLVLMAFWLVQVRLSRRPRAA